MARGSTSDGGSLGRHGGGRRRRGPIALTLTLTLMLTSVATALAAPNLELDPDPGGEPRLDVDYLDADAPAGPRVLVDGVPLDADYTGFAHWGAALPFFESRRVLRTDADRLTVAVEVPDDDPEAYHVSLSVLYSAAESFDDGEGGTFEVYDNRTASSAELVALFWDAGAACGSMGVVDRTVFPGSGGEGDEFAVTPIPELPGFAIPSRGTLSSYNGGRPSSMLVASSEVTSAAPLVCTLRTIPGTTISVTVEIGQVATVHAAVAEELPRQLAANAYAFAETEGGPLTTFDGIEAHSAFQEVQAWTDTLPEECELDRDSSRLALLAWVARTFDPASVPEDAGVPSAAAVAELAGLLRCPGDLDDVARALSELWYGGRVESLDNDFQDAVFGAGCSLADGEVRSTDLLAWVVGTPYPDPPTPEWMDALAPFVNCGPEGELADAVDALNTLWVGVGGARERFDAALGEEDDCALDVGIAYDDVAEWLAGAERTAADLFECDGGTGSELEDAAGQRVNTLWYGVPSGYRSVLDGGVFGADCDYAPASGPADLARLAISGPFDGDALDVFINCTDPGPTTLDDLAGALAAAWSGEDGAQDELDQLLAAGSCEYLDGAAVPEVIDWVDDVDRTTEGLALLLACTAGDRALARSLLFDLQGPLLVDEEGPLPLFPVIGNWLGGAVGFTLGPGRDVCTFDLAEGADGGDAGDVLADLLEAVRGWQEAGAEGPADLEGILDCPDGRVDIQDPDGRAVAFLISATDPDLADSRDLPEAEDADEDGRIGGLHWVVAREVARGATYGFSDARDDWRDAVGPGFGSGLLLDAAAVCVDDADLGPCLVSVGGGDGVDGADGIEDGWAVILNDRSFALEDVSIGELLGMAARLTLVRTDPRGTDGLGVFEGDRVRVHLRLPAQGPDGQDWSGALRPFLQTTGEVLGHAVTSVADDQAVELETTLSARQRSAAFDYPSGEDRCAVGVEAGPGGPAAEATDCDLPDAAAEIVEVRLRSPAFLAGHDPARSGTEGVRSTRRLTEWGIDPLRDAAERGVEDCDSGLILANVPDPVCVEDGLHVMLFTEGDAPGGERAVAAGDRVRVGGLVDLTDLASGLGLGSVPAEWETFEGTPLEVVADGGFFVAVRIPDELVEGVEAVHEACSGAMASPYASEILLDELTRLCLPSAWRVDEVDARAYDPGAVVVLRTAGPHGFITDIDPAFCPEGTVPVVVSQLGQQFDGSRCASLPDAAEGLEDDELALQIAMLNVDEAFRQDRSGVVVLGAASTYVLSDTSIVADLYGIDPDAVGPLDARSDAALALAGGFVATNGQGFDFGADLLEAEAFDFALAGPSVDEDYVAREDDGFFQVFLPAPYLGLLAESAGITADEAANAMGVERRDGADTEARRGAVTAGPSEAGEFGLGSVTDPGVVISSEGFTYSTPFFSIAPEAGLAIASESLGVLTRRQRVRTQLEAERAEGPLRWSVASGALPGGVSLSRTGALGGRPRAAGTGSVVLRVTDGTSVAEREVAWRVSLPLAVMTRTLAPAVATLPYSAGLGSSGGFGDVTWSVVGGALPRGLALDGDGSITGEPLGAGRSRVTLRATDEEGRSAERRFDLRVLADGVRLGDVTFERFFVRGRTTVVALVETESAITGAPLGRVRVEGRWTVSGVEDRRTSSAASGRTDGIARVSSGARGGDLPVTAFGFCVTRLSARGLAYVPPEDPDAACAEGGG